MRQAHCRYRPAVVLLWVAPTSELEVSAAIWKDWIGLQDYWMSADTMLALRSTSYLTEIQARSSRRPLQYLWPTWCRLHFQEVEQAADMLALGAATAPPGERGRGGTLKLSAWFLRSVSRQQAAHRHQKPSMKGRRIPLPRPWSLCLARCSRAPLRQIRSCDGHFLPALWRALSPLLRGDSLGRADPFLHVQPAVHPP